MKSRRVLLSLSAVALVVVLGVWALATIHLQTELLPLFPKKLASVRGVQLSMSVLSSAQQATIVLTQPAATAEIADRLEVGLKRLPDVQAVSVVGQRKIEPMVKMAAWAIANLPPDKFAEFQSLFSEREMDARLQDAREQLSGALDARSLFLLRADPLQVLSWLQRQPHQSLPLPDFSAGNAPSVVAMQVRARRPLRTFDECEHFVGALRGVVSSVVPPPMRSAIYITGQPAFVAENSAQMRRDMTVMVLLATGLCSLVLWLFYRSQSAVLWMTVVLALAILTGAIAARAFFGELNVISIGFGSILIGLGSDYCIWVYHFHSLGGEGEWKTVRRGIWLSATTTSLAFGTLYFSSFPGLQQMVVLIIAGLLATAFFATTLLSEILQRVKPVAPAWLTTMSDGFAAWQQRHRQKIVWAVAASLVLAACCWPVARHYKFYDADFNRLRPEHSEANRGVEVLMESTKARRTFDVIVQARSWEELRAKAARVSREGTLLPQEDHLVANRSQWKTGKQAALRAALDRAGFEESWGAATLVLLDTMDAWAGGRDNFESVRQFLTNVVELPSGEKIALLRLPMEGGPRETWDKVERREPSSLPASWQLMVEDLQRGVLRDARTLSLWMLAAVALVCWWAGRSWMQAALHGLALALTFFGLLALLWITRESMTLHSLLTVPLMVAVAIEYSLYMLLALESNAGDVRLTFRQLAVPVLLMGLTTIFGFGAPIATHQPTLQNFGMVMAMGTFAALVTGLVVVPVLYSTLRPRPHYSQMLYRAFWFDVGAWIGKTFGKTVARALGAAAGAVYQRTHPRTGAAVRANLQLLQPLPVAAHVVRRTFANFGETMADYFLLGTRPRHEVLALAEERVGFENLKQVFNEGKGALLVTAHLGLFEFGSLLMEELGHATVVVSLPEPTPALSQWRAAYRKRWSADTLEVGEDQFSFVEITRQLAKGKCVAMLMDRPVGTNYVLVDFPNGKVPFSTGPVWLSLLSGSPLVAVTCVKLPTGRYRVEAHTPIRPQWLNGARDETVERYARALADIFRKVICEHPDQWYQFVPLTSQR